MRPVESVLEVELRTTPIANVSPMYAVGIPPSDIDPVWDEIRVDVGGMMISRAFDPGEDIETGAPIGMLTESGDTLITEAGDRIVSEVVA